MPAPRAHLPIVGIILLAAPSSAIAQRMTREHAVTFPAYPGDSTGVARRVSVRTSGQPGARTFDLTTTAPQREGDPQQRSVRESPGQPHVVTGNPLFDALFAVALDDARQASVATIKDGSYNDGKPIDCPCFETGEKWHYVWTRDLSYALDLGLARFDPPRAVSSLLFKTSGFRSGLPLPADLPADSRQVIQDTGSGGSWPISTDRTTWALGAEATLAVLRGPARGAFARAAYDALRGTVEADRVAAFDPRDGLYGGEHSFLDWREQSYAPWIVDALPLMAQSKGVSTNVVQLRALRLAARLGRELGDTAAAARYARWGDELAPAIERAFWDPAASMYATYTTADRFAARIAKYDLLGNALAVLSGLATPERARAILSSYPFAPFGPPVVWPQAPDEYVYHNRAIWPFVTAYALHAAVQGRHVAAADRSLASLVRGAALHLSNMENLEWLTGQSRFDDGPAINSRRQLWSIGAYLGAVTTAVFGWHEQEGHVTVAPFLTSATRALLGDVASVRLAALSHDGKPVEIVLELPPAAPEGHVYDVREILLNGSRTTGQLDGARLRRDANRVVVRFGEARKGDDVVRTIPEIAARSHDDPRAFMPRTPEARVHRDETGTVTLTMSSPDAGVPIAYRVFRDGRLLAENVRGGSWSDPAPAASANTACYSVVAVNTSTALASQPSFPSCDRGTASHLIGASDARVTGGTLLPAGDSVAVITRRVALGDRLTISGVEIPTAGDYAIAAEYDNHVFALNTGVTNAVKRLTVVGSDGSRHVAILQMPHIRPIDGRHPIRPSTRAYVRLAPGRYTIEIGDYFNMSMLEANASYTGPGGKGGALNEARIATITIDRLPDE